MFYHIMPFVVFIYSNENHVLTLWTCFCTDTHGKEGRDRSARWWTIGQSLKFAWFFGLFVAIGPNGMSHFRKTGQVVSDVGCGTFHTLHLSKQI